MALAGSTEVDGAPPHADDDLEFGLRDRDALRLAAITVGAIVAFFVIAIDWDSPVRTVLALGFMLFVPGLALAELLEISDPVQRVAFAIGASLAVETLVCLVLLYAGAFSATAAAAVVFGLTAIALFAVVARRDRRGREPRRGRPAT